MSGGLERLGDYGAGARPPDPAAIRARGRRIEQRRRAAVGAAAAAAAFLAAGVVLFRPAADQPPLAVSAPSEAPELATDVTGLAEEDAATSGTPLAAVATPQRRVTAPSAAAPEAASSGAAAPRRAGAANAAAADPGGDGLTATIEVAGSPARPGDPARFTLRVCNGGSSTVQRSFSDGQRYDFEVRRGSAVVWRWSDGRFFTQSLGTERWTAGACKTWTESWDARSSSGAPVSPGSYEVTGSLAGSPPVRSAPRTVCAVAC